MYKFPFTAFPCASNQVHGKCSDPLHSQLHRDQNQDFKTPCETNQKHLRKCFALLARQAENCACPLEFGCTHVSAQVNRNPLTLLGLNSLALSWKDARRYKLDKKPKQDCWRKHVCISKLKPPGRALDAKKGKIAGLKFLPVVSYQSFGLELLKQKAWFKST